MPGIYHVYVDVLHIHGIYMVYPWIYHVCPTYTWYIHGISLDIPCISIRLDSAGQLAGGTKDTTRMAVFCPEFFYLENYDVW
jgi:hypothetical protein